MRLISWHESSPSDPGSHCRHQAIISELQVAFEEDDQKALNKPLLVETDKPTTATEYGFTAEYGTQDNP